MTNVSLTKVIENITLTADVIHGAGVGLDGQVAGAGAAVRGASQESYSSGDTVDIRVVVWGIQEVTVSEAIDVTSNIKLMPAAGGKWANATATNEVSAYALESAAADGDKIVALIVPPSTF